MTAPTMQRPPAGEPASNQQDQPARRVSSGLLDPKQLLASIPDAVKKLDSFEPDRICRAGLSALTEVTPESIRGYLEKPAENQDIRAFLDYLRTMAIDGYYTSKEGLKELDYRGNSFYSESPGCTHDSHTG